MPLRISAVYIWTNGTVMVFDESGNQVAELQGAFADRAKEISRLSDQSTNFFMAKWNGNSLPIHDKESFDRLWRKDAA